MVAHAILLLSVKQVREYFFITIMMSREVRLRKST